MTKYHHTAATGTLDRIFPENSTQCNSMNEIRLGKAMSAIVIVQSKFIKSNFGNTYIYKSSEGYWITIR